MNAPDRPEPGDAAARFVGGLSRERDEEPARKVTGWDRAARVDGVWALKWGCLWVGVGTVLSGAMVVGFLVWMAMEMGRSIVEGIGESLQASMQPFVEELRAADALASVPAPPPEVGTAEQAAALGPAVADALNASDRAAVVRLLNAPSLLRGLVEPETAGKFAAALADGTIEAEGFDLDPFDPQAPTVIARSDATPTDPEAVAPGDPPRPPPRDPPAWAGEDAEPQPPGTGAVLYWATSWSGIAMSENSSGAFAIAEGVRFDGVTTHDGLPAAALVFTEPGEDPDPCDGVAEVGTPVERQVLLIPAPDGRIGSMFFVGTQPELDGFPAPEGGETFAAAFRRSGRALLAPMLENFENWPEGVEPNDQDLPPSNITDEAP